MKIGTGQETIGILGDRETQVLHTIILQYINTGEPVGSRTVSRSSGLSLSPATIRNLMFDLEEKGLLNQPHLSAGRIPTPQGFRYYVDHILASRDLQASARLQIEGGFSPPPDELHDLIRRHIQFINAGGDQILTVLVSHDGVVQNRFIKSSKQFSQEQLDKFSRYLNDLLKNLSLVEARQLVLAQLEEEKVLFDRMLSQALTLSQKALQAEEDEELFVEGASQILDYPEFAEIDKIRALFRAFEEKQQLIKLLDESLASEGVKIFISPKTPFPEVEWSMVTSNFQRDQEPIGAVGIIGPMRMNYVKIIPLVQFTASVMSGILNKWSILPR
jgi:heat-inducible transcriptional repressor